MQKKKVQKTSRDKRTEQIKMLDPNSLKPYEQNPRKNENAIQAVVDSIREFGFKQPIVIDKSGIIIVGHTRWQAAILLGLSQVPVIEAKDLTPAQVKAYRIADNQTNNLSDWDVDLLKLEIVDLQKMDVDLDVLGFSNVKMDSLLCTIPTDTDVEPQLHSFTSSSVATEVLSDCDSVLCQFSGGKDSLLALHWAIDKCKDMNKPISAVFVETGAEFPDLTSYIIRTCAALDVPLSLIHPQDNIVAYYYQRKQWPDAIYRECLHRFINEPVNKQVRALALDDKKIVVVRGGRKTQKTSRSKSSIYQKVKDGKRIIHLLNPLFDVSEKEYRKSVESFQSLLWPGYGLGFERTACWMCPFQKHAQWEALHQYYPLLWAEMLKLAKTLSWHEHKGDANIRRFYGYWKSKT